MLTNKIILASAVRLGFNTLVNILWEKSKKFNFFRKPITTVANDERDELMNCVSEIGKILI